MNKTIYVLTIILPSAIAGYVIVAYAHEYDMLSGCKESGQLHTWTDTNIKCTTFDINRSIRR